MLSAEQQLICRDVSKVDALPPKRPKRVQKKARQNTENMKPCRIGQHKERNALAPRSRQQCRPEMPPGDKPRKLAPGPKRTESHRATGVAHWSTK